MPYQTIVADPPWPYRSARAMPVREELTKNRYGGNVTSVERYGSMSIGALKCLMVPAASNAHLYLWTTNAFICEAHHVARAWGFKPKTIITWVKIKKDGSPSMKTGYYFRGATEHCLFAVRGKLRLTGSPKPTAFSTTRLPHSVKPERFFEMVEDCSPAPRLEMFARKERRGWDVWGNEVESSIEIRSL